MNMPVVRRAPDGKLLAGSCLNPGGRPKAAIEEVREILGRHKEKKPVEWIGREAEGTTREAIRAPERQLTRLPVAS